MYCRVCGDESATYRPACRQSMCDACAEGAPRKASREGFDAAYWGKEADTVPEGIKREFYSDYLCSKHTVEQYKAATTEPYGD